MGETPAQSDAPLHLSDSKQSSQDTATPTNLACFSVENAHSYLTGEVLLLDGGLNLT